MSADEKKINGEPILSVIVPITAANDGKATHAHLHEREDTCRFRSSVDSD